MEKITSIIDNRLENNNEDSFQVLSLKDVALKYKRWIKAMPRVTPYYAMKCNDHEEVLRTLMNLGAGFDCASPKEISQVLSMGSQKIVYTHIAKQNTHIKFAADNNVQRLTFDSAEELLKIKANHPNADVVLRFSYDDQSLSHSIFFGEKFGCDRSIEAPKLINLCKKLEMNLIGISFHVGSSSKNYEIFYHALAEVKKLFDFAEHAGFNLSLVDIGGGFVGDDLKKLQNYAKFINEGIEEYFPDPSIEIISEPGRYFVDTAFKIATKIVLKKKKNETIYYYTNEGIYMSFLARHMYKDSPVNFSLIRKTPKKNAEELSSVIYGVTCHPCDVIMDERKLEEMETGDWLIFHNMGAYSFSHTTSFNGFSIGDIVLFD